MPGERRSRFKNVRTSTSGALQPLLPLPPGPRAIPFGMKTDDLPGDDEIVVESKEKPEVGVPDAAGASSSSSDTTHQKENQNPPEPRRNFTVPSSLAWIPQNLTWSKLKPVIRCSLVAWVSALFMIIGPVSHAVGQVSVKISLVRRALMDVNRC